MDIKEKETYEKPVLRTIELLAEEVLGSGCYKPTQGGSPMNAGTCNIGTCSVPGTS